MYCITVILQQNNHRYPGERIVLQLYYSNITTGTLVNVLVLHLYYSDITTGTLVNVLYYSYTTAI